MFPTSPKPELLPLPLNHHQTMPTEPTGPKPEETALGGATVEIQFTNGQSDVIHVRQLKLREMPQFARALEDPGAIIMLTCGRNAEWVDALTPESFERLALEADRVNRDFFMRWASLQKARLAALGPVQVAALGGKTS